MNKIINAIIGDLSEKKRYHQIEKRAKVLPAEYADAYNEIKQYLWKTSGILTIEPLASLLELLEEAAANDKRVIDVTGADVAAFTDDLVRGESSYKDQERKKLNDRLNKKAQ